MSGILPRRFDPTGRWEDTSASAWNAWLEATKTNTAKVQTLWELVRKLMRRRLVAGEAAAATGVAHFKVASPADWYQHHNGDAILAHTWDGTTEGEEAITIAKPHKIRRTPFDQTGLHNGVKYEYAFPTLMIRKSIKGVGDDEVKLTFVVTPSYYAGEIIEARRGPTLLDDVVWQDTTVRTWGLHPEEGLP